MSKRVGYVRVSTEDQCLSVAGQEVALREYGVVDIYQDVGISGGAPLDARLGLLAAMNILEAGDELVVVRRDRLARKVLTSAIIEHMVEKTGATIHSLAREGNGEGPEDALMRTIVAGIAEYERAIIVARTKAALAVKKSRGERTGSVPYGWSLGRDRKTLVVNTEEQVAIRMAKALKAEGLTLRAIGAELTKQGYRPRGKGGWHPTTVKNLLNAREA